MDSPFLTSVLSRLIFLLRMVGSLDSRRLARQLSQRLYVPWVCSAATTVARLFPQLN